MYNEVTLIGRLGQNPELRFTKNNRPVCNFSVATSKKIDGKELTQWHRIIVWNAQAEACNKYLKKGSLVAISGEVGYREYTPQNGEEKRQVTEITANRVMFMDSKKLEDEVKKPNEEPIPSASTSDIDDIPF